MPRGAEGQIRGIGRVGSMLSGSRYESVIRFGSHVDSSIWITRMLDSYWAACMVGMVAQSSSGVWTIGKKGLLKTLKELRRGGYLATSEVSGFLQERNWIR